MKAIVHEYMLYVEIAYTRILSSSVYTRVNHSVLKYRLHVMIVFVGRGSWSDKVWSRQDEGECPYVSLGK